MSQHIFITGKEIRESEIIEDEQTFAFSEDHKNEIGLLRKQLDEANERIAEAEEVIKYYAGEGDRRTYLDVFDCISRESESVTDFDSDRFAKAARAYLNKYSDKKGE